jgi:multiple sugar transport system substrate-binding protein
MAAQSIPPLQVLAEPLRLAGGVRVLVHGDPTFMVMDNLKRQFEQVVGTDIHQRAFSIDRLHQEALRNAERKHSRYDIIAVDLPWIGEFAEKGVLMPLDEAWTSTAGSGRFPHGRLARRALGRRPYGVPAQTTPELLFYRKDIFAEAGMEPPATTTTSSRRQNHFHDPARVLRNGLECGARHGARPHLHDDLRRFRPAGHRPSAGGRRLQRPTRSSKRPTAR